MNKKAPIKSEVASRRRFLALGAAMPSLLTPTKEAAGTRIIVSIDAASSAEFYKCLKAKPDELAKALLQGLEGITETR